MVAFRFAFFFSALALFSVVHAEPIGTSFTYQGELNQQGIPASGAYDFQFDIYDVANDGIPVATTVQIDDAIVVDGVFTVELDFGSAAFNGDQLWLDIAVRDGASEGEFTALLPRQAIAPAPFALFALSGNEGPAGAIGPAGPQGDTGLTGPAGPQGETGLAGPAGDTGLMGPAGSQGDIGLTGAAGDIGLTGPAGPQGDTGLTGAAGDTGLSYQMIGGWNITDTTTTYYTTIYSWGRTTNSDQLQAPMLAGVVRNLLVQSLVDSTNDGDDSKAYVHTVRKNKVPTSLSCEIFGEGVLSCTDTTNCLEFNLGDTFNFVSAPQNAPDNTGQVLWVAEFEIGGTCTP